MQRLTQFAGMAVMAGLALAAVPAAGSAAGPFDKGKEARRGVVTVPVAYDKSTNRVADVVLWWSEAGKGAQRAQLVTTDLDVVTPAKLAGVRAELVARLEAGELEATVEEGFQDDIEGLEDLAGGTAVQDVADGHLADLLGSPGMRLGSTTTAGDANDTFNGIAGGLGGVLGMQALIAEGTAVGLSGGPAIGGSFVAGVAMGAGINALWDVTLSAVSGGEVSSLGDLAYEVWCGSDPAPGCGADGTTAPPDMDPGSAAGVMRLYLATGLGADELERQLTGLEIAAGADVGVTREREDLAAWLAIDARLGGEYLRSIQRGLDARGSRHGVRDRVHAGGGIDPTQIFNYGRITPMPEVDRIAVGIARP